MQRKLDRKGFSIVEALIVIVVIVAVALCGWLAWHHTHDKKSPTTSTKTSSPQSKSSSASSSTSTAPADPYAGWKTAVSPRAKFSIKYPANWSYAETIGNRDNVEHITLSSANIQLTIDSYQGTDLDSGGQPATTCPDCSKVLKSTPFNVGSVGSLDLESITYNLDNGTGNALIIEEPNGTYYIPSSDAQGVSTSFRAISNLPSLAAYQAETPQVFTSNPDFATAEKILQSVAY